MTIGHFVSVLGRFRDQESTHRALIRATGTNPHWEKERRTSSLWLPPLPSHVHDYYYNLQSPFCLALLSGLCEPLRPFSKMTLPTQWPLKHSNGHSWPMHPFQSLLLFLSLSPSVKMRQMRWVEHSMLSLNSNIKKIKEKARKRAFADVSVS